MNLEADLATQGALIWRDQPGVRADVARLCSMWSELLAQHSGPLLFDHFTVADAYLFTVLGWCRYGGLDLAQWPTLQAYHQRIAHRPSVQAAMRAEGLIK